MSEIKDNVKHKHTIGARGKWYSPLTNCIYLYQSSYEREMMRVLDNHNIRWIKNTKRFPYYIEDKKHNYIPDFYLPDYDMYLEVKGFLRKSDPIKLEACSKSNNICLIESQDLIKLGCKVFNPDDKNYKVDVTKWPLNVLHRSEEWTERGQLNEDLKNNVSSKKFFDILKEKR